MNDAMQPPLTLRCALAPYPHVRALLDGRVISERVGFEFESVTPITRAFRRMVRTLDFDLCEIALTTLAQARAFGKPITGLPVVVMRGLHHAALVCPRESALRGPADLIGRSVAVRAYSQTTGVWLRGILHEQYGVDHRRIEWLTEEDAHVREYADPPNVRRIEPGQQLGAMLLSGEAAAGIALAGVDPARMRPVIADPDAASAAWLRAGGAYPDNHVLCVRTALLEAHPWLADELFRLFVAARAAADEPSTEERYRRLIGDPLPYGLAANHAAIALGLRYAAEQGLIPCAGTPEGLFADCN
jgi:4,5-dihydroxyphthalate decarboxylase